MIDPIWVPSKSRIERSNMMRFITTLQKQFPEIKNYQDLYQWSINNPENFWEAIWEFCGVKYKNSYEKVLVDGDKLPGAKWFVGSKINFVENLSPEKYRREVFLYNKVYVFCAFFILDSRFTILHNQ